MSQFLGFIGFLTLIPLLITHGIVSLSIWLISGKTICIKPACISKTININCATKPIIQPSELIIISIPILIALSSLLSTITQAPGGTDVWTYHMAFPAEWHIWHDLRATFQHSGDPGPPYYPHHSGLIVHLLLTTLHSDILARFHQVILWLTGLIALYIGMKNIQISRPAALTATALVGTMPIVGSWVNVAFADISLAGAIALVFYSVTRLKINNGWHGALTFGLATGLASGFKAFGAYYSIPLVIWGLIIILRHSQKKIISLGAWFSGSLITGSFWFLRNLILNGNPFFPYQPELAGTILFPGLYTRSHIISHGFHSFGFMGQFTFSELLRTVGGPGYLLVITVFLCLFWSLKSHRHLYLSLIPLLMGAQFFFLPYRYHPRFLLPALWLCAPAAAIFLDQILQTKTKINVKANYQFNRKFTVYLLIIIFTVMITPYTAFKPLIVLPILVLLAFLFPLIFKHISGSFLKLRKYTIILTLLLFPVMMFGFPIIIDEYEANKWKNHHSDLGKIAQWLTNVSSKIEHLEIAFAGFNTPYPLFGPHLCNSVRFISRDGDFDKSWTGNKPYTPPASTENFKAWNDLLKKTSIDLIVIGTIPGQPFPPEYFWVRSMENFQIVFLANSYQCWLRTDLVQQIL
ncbi:phospholipid carrier-dependent glycosyltransferase [bacterium]|nr:phospholipid carrier-dependent glycosyltransferase [bacterium]